MSKYLLYHLRWQTGFIIQFPLTYLFIDIMQLPTWIYCILFAFIGACIYWYVDKAIFKIDKK